MFSSVHFRVWVKYWYFFNFTILTIWSLILLAHYKRLRDSPASRILTQSIYSYGHFEYTDQLFLTVWYFFFFFRSRASAADSYSNDTFEPSTTPQISRRSNKSPRSPLDKLGRRGFQILSGRDLTTPKSLFNKGRSSESESEESLSHTGNGRKRYTFPTPFYKVFIGRVI